MEKPQLINFIAKVMEDSGFKIYKNFKTSRKTIDIYAVLPTSMGDFGVVVACKNYDRTFEIGVEVLREVEELQRSVNASKITIVASCYFSTQAKNYAIRKNIKLVDRDKLLELARKYQDKTSQTTLDNTPYDGGASQYIEEEYPEYSYEASDMDYIMRERDANPGVYKNTLYRNYDEPQSQGGFKSLIENFSNSRESTNLYNYESRRNPYGFDSILFMLLRNPLIIIILVVIISYIIAFILGNVFKADAGFTGLVEMFVALLLSYLLALFSDRDSNFIVKGTFIFFISLIILIILIFV